MSSAWSYLQERRSLPPLAIFALIYTIFEALLWHTPHASWALGALVAAAIAAIASAPRWTVYLALAFAFVLVTSDRSEAARGPHDRQSDRDEAAEQATTRFLHRQNPWLLRTSLGNQITSGPGTVVLALPWVAASGQIDGLTFLFWLTMAALFLAGDLRQHNGAFPTLVLLYLIGELNLSAGQYWSHEELAYGVPFMALAWYATTRRWFVTAGALAAYAVAIRLSYAYVGLGLLAWLVCERRATWRELARLAAGGLATLATLFVLFFIVLRQQLFVDGPFAIAAAKAAQAWPPDNFLYVWLSATIGRLPARVGTWVRTLLVAIALFVPAWRLRNRPAGHPFWYMAGGHLAAFALVAAVSGRFANDYVMPLVLLGFLGVAFSTTAASARATT